MKKVFSIFLSFLLLVSSSGIGYAQHFCGGHEMVSEITLGEQHLSCGMDVATPEDCNTETINATENHCCDNQFTTVDTDDTFAKVSFNFSFNHNFVAAFTQVFVLEYFEAYQANKHFYADYNPPPLDKDIPVLYQTFLI